MFSRFLTREERIVCVALSLCLLGGGVYTLAGSLFELPEEVRMPGAGWDGESDLGSGIGDVPGGGRWAVSEPPTPGAGDAGRVGEAADGSGIGAGVGQKAGPRSPSGMLDLNSAGSAELEALPGIGPALASRIIETREALGGFKSVDDLLQVRGIGVKTLARFREWVFVSDAR
ncbi:MAG: ComEA family DNA-binding protein [Candidatus Eisenbacteria bacterium]